MLADDLLGGVALEPAGARIPARDDPRRVEHVDRIVRHRLDEQPVTALGRQAVEVAGVRPILEGFLPVGHVMSCPEGFH